jgi:hypothetical protein
VTHSISLGVDFFTIVKKVEVEIEWIYIVLKIGSYIFDHLLFKMV